LSAGLTTALAGLRLLSRLVAWLPLSTLLRLTGLPLPGLRLILRLRLAFAW
jgi:hypothetical protein